MQSALRTEGIHADDKQCGWLRQKRRVRALFAGAQPVRVLACHYPRLFNALFLLGVR